MIVHRIANSGNDEYYTPPYAVAPILKYLNPDSKVWCPFDTEDSYFVKMLRHEGHEVVATHISGGADFFETETPDATDYIISNPPYSLKTEVLQNLFERKVPFAMLLGIVGIFDSLKRFEMFRDNDFEVMYMNRRISFFKDYADQKPAVNPPFSSAYFCSGVLPKQIVFEEIDKKNVSFEGAA